MGKETSERIQTSLLNSAEKKLLVWLAVRQPRWVTSDMLTWLGVAGTAVYMLGGILSCGNVLWLWLASLGLVVHWYGDSLDGTLARVRGTQRPVYGFFIDHSLDAVTTCMIFFGAGFSPLLRMDVALAALAGYLCLSVYTYVCTIVKGEFRLLLILLNIFYMYTPWGEWHCQGWGGQWSAFDLVGLAVAVVLFVIFFAQFAADRRVLSRQDPLKRP